MSIFRNPVLCAKIKHSKLFYSESTIDWQNIQVLLFSQNQQHTCVDCTFLLACCLALIQRTDHHSLKMLDFVFHLHRIYSNLPLKYQINFGVIARLSVKINLSCIFSSLLHRKTNDLNPFGRHNTQMTYRLVQHSIHY